MDPLQHDCFCEGIQQELTLEGVFPKVALVLGAGLEVASVSQQVQSSMGSSCPKSPTNMMEVFPKAKLLGSRPASLKHRRLPCCMRRCIRAKKALSMKEISSTIRSMHWAHVASSFWKAGPSS